MNPNYFYNLYKNQIWYSELSILGVASIVMLISGIDFKSVLDWPEWIGYLFIPFGLYLMASFLHGIVEHDETIQAQINHDRKQMQNFDKNRRRVPVIYE